MSMDAAVARLNLIDVTKRYADGAPSPDFIMRNAMDAVEIAVGWWPGDARYPQAAFYAYAHPASPGLPAATLPMGRWDEKLSEYILDWDDVRSAPDPHSAAVEFAATIMRHACVVCD